MCFSTAVKIKVKTEFYMTIFLFINSLFHFVFNIPSTEQLLPVAGRAHTLAVSTQMRNIKMGNGLPPAQQRTIF
jgi:hypothetical protein